MVAASKAESSSFHPSLSSSPNGSSKSKSQSPSASARPTRGIKRRRPGHPTPLVEQVTSKAARGSSSRPSRKAVAAPVAPTEAQSGDSFDILSTTDDIKAKEEDQEPDPEEAKEQRLLDGWKEEYFEIVEQLPLELHRSFSLLRELELQVTSHLETVRDETLAYRDWRFHRAALRKQGSDTAIIKPEVDEAMAVSDEAARAEAGSVSFPMEAEDDGLNTPPLPPNHPQQQRAPSGLEIAPETQSQGKASQARQEENEVGAVLGVPQQVSGPGFTANDEPGKSHTTVSDEAGEGVSFSLLPVASTSEYTRHPALSRISRAINSSMAASEEKVGLALSVYQLIDRQCRRLDADLAKITGTTSVAAASAAATAGASSSASALAASTNSVAPDGVHSLPPAHIAPNGITMRPGTQESTQSKQQGNGGSRGRRKSTADPFDSGKVNTVDTGAQHGQRSRRGQGPEASAVQNGANAATATGEVARSGIPDIVADMAYDPSEPVYCYCRQPSFGFMVGCDNDECEREWYHLSCLENRGELTRAVLQSLEDDRKKWFCKDCRAAKGGAAAPGADDGYAGTGRKKGRKSRR